MFRTDFFARTFAATLAIVTAGAVFTPAVAASFETPRGYKVTAQDEVAGGLEHIALAGAKQRINIAKISSGAKLELRPVLAGDAINGTPALERTSAMCARVSCMAAVNGDFFALSGVPTGGVVTQGELVRSATSPGQLLVDEAGKITPGKLRFELALVTSDLERLSLEGVNVNPGPNSSVLFTNRFGRTTRTKSSVVELTLRIDRPGGALQVGETATGRILGLSNKGNTAIPRDGAVLAARGKDAARLRAVWKRIRSGASPQVLLRVDSNPSTAASLGGKPVLVRDGKIVVPSSRSSFADGKHPRTLVGRTGRGEVMLVVVDGRQPGFSEGMTLKQAASLMRSLGAVDAINLDGGGSSTFVLGGKVINRPSDRAVKRAGKTRIVGVPRKTDTIIGNVERPVAMALTVVAASGSAKPVTAKAADPFPATALALEAPTRSDPASNPDAGLPALVALGAPIDTAREMAIASAALLWALVAAALIARSRSGLRRLGLLLLQARVHGVDEPEQFHR